MASLPEGETFIAISSGVAHTCGLREDGTAVCWAMIEEDGLEVQPSPEGEALTSISSGAYHVCGLREDGTPVCWLVVEGLFGEGTG